MRSVSIDTPGPATTFLPAKLSPPPAVPGLVDRPRLLHMLDRAVADHPLTVVAGPAGSGKTTLLTGWAARTAATWVTLDPHDDDPTRFWALVHRAAGVPPALATAQDPAGALAAHLAEAPGDAPLVIDCFDTITDPQILAGLERLLRRPLPRLRLVLATRRAVDALHLARLRIEGRACVIEADALRLTLGETEQLLRNAGIDLAADDAAALWMRTEGWPATVGLAALALRGRERPREHVRRLCGDEPYLCDYLTEELLTGVDDDVRDFLLHTGIVDELSGELADVLTGERGGGAVLVGLQRAGLPVAHLEAQRDTFRYHPLFAGMLRSRLAREDASLGHELHRRAARWFAVHGPSHHAIRHAVLAHDPELTSALLATRVVPAMRGGNLPLALRVLVPPALHPPARATAAAFTPRTPAIAPAAADADAPGDAAGAGDDGALLDPLSRAELAILPYVMTGMTNLEVARERCISVNTVKTHLKQIYRKLGVDNRRAAAVRARELGLLGRG